MRDSASRGHEPAPEQLTGTVIRAVSNIYDVRPDAVSDGLPEIVRCTLRDRLRKNLVLTESKARAQRVRQVRRLRVVEPVAVGDRVRFVTERGSGTSVQLGVIEEVLPRQRELTRQAVTTGSTPVGQTLVANLDQVILIFSATSPDPALGLLDRFLVSCESAGLPAVVCINKVDLGVDEPLAEQLEAFVTAGYPLLFVSAATGQGMDDLREVVRDKISAFVGPSGVGKSTLLNALEPGLGLKVGEISAYSGKGKHTTRFAQLVPLRQGGFIVDTPGLRQLALWEVSKDELDRMFPEFRPYLERCRFGNCAHINDDGCAVREAAEQDEIDPRRYLSYVKLFQEV